MTTVLTISLGPVQEFIAAARKTRDLWAGSYILSEITRAAAQAVADKKCRLVFPAESVLKNEDAPIANKILAVVTGGGAAEAAEAAEAARRAASNALEDLAKEAFKEARSLGEPFKEDAALKQTRDLLEFFWASASAENYPDARARAEALLAACKATRVWKQPSWSSAGVPKSSIDGLRESVLDESLFNGGEETLKRLGIGAAERLCGVGMLKRLTKRNNKKVFFDSVDDVAGKYPYYAVILADGDHMGVEIAAKTDPDQHVMLSEKLTEAVGEWKKPLEEKGGMLIYAGGDDLLAFLPVDKALSCAIDIRARFKKTTGLNLSAGVAICHKREMLGEALAAARRAEKLAKIQRDSLGLVFQKRSGGEVKFLVKWESIAVDLDPLLNGFREQALPRKFAYELRRLAMTMGPQSRPDILRSEALRILSRKRADGGTAAVCESVAKVVESLIKPAEGENPSAALRRAADAIILAGLLAGVDGEPG